MSIEQDIHAALARVVDVNTGKDLAATKSIRNLRLAPRGDATGVTDVSLEVELGYPAGAHLDVVRAQVEAALRATAGVGTIDVRATSRVATHAVQRGTKPMPNVKNVIAVASGKGGVGKSTTAVNLALALAADGAKVGLLDADIYGPSQPVMLGLSGKPETKDGKTMEPRVAHGIEAMSIGFLIDADEPMVWRGPMVTQAMTQLLDQTNWHDLDYLVVDMPPGTGDIQLTLSQKVPVTGAVIVTTPQDIALADARKGLRMFEKVGIPILGVIENMSQHVCSNCGHVEHVFGVGGGERLCAQYGVDYLGGLPLDIRIREQADSGTPTVVAEPDGAIARAYREIARKVAVAVAGKAKDLSAKFPTIVVRDT